MAMRIRVTTRADLYEKREQEHIERGYRIEDELPDPCERLLVLCRHEGGASSPMLVDELLAQAINGGRGSYCD